jgi:Rieske Fe-S protein
MSFVLGDAGVRQEADSRELVERKCMAEGSDRRGFLTVVIKGSVALISAITVIPGIGMLVSPLIFRPKPKERKILFANPQDSQSGSFVAAELEGEGEIAAGVFVKRAQDGSAVVLSSLCTHAGCAVNWEQAQGKFHCRCHEGFFDAEGKNIAGPPPKPLMRLTVIERNGELFIQEPEV